MEEIDLGAMCNQPCPPGSSTCPPRQQVRSLEVLIGARSVADTTVVRSVRADVRVRHDGLVGACPV
jgi:hypothetical protein